MNLHIFRCVDVKLFKWSNLVNHIGNDKIMLAAFEKFKARIDLCNWENPSDIMKLFRTADTITCKGQAFNRIVFDVGGNKYRLICGYKFGKRNILLYIRFVGTHSEYDETDACKVNMF